MGRKKLIPVLLIGAFVVAAAFGVTAYRSVKAAAPVLKTLTSTNFGRGVRGGYTDQDLADALGITVDKLQAAYTSAWDEALKQAVANGDITQKQADQLKANSNGRFRDFGLFNDTTIDYDSLLAKALNVSVDQLKAAYQKAHGTAIDRAVTNGSLTQAQADQLKAEYALSNSSKFISALQAAFQAAVKQAVTDGLITQSQADQILQNQNGTTMGFPGMKGFGGFGGGLREFGGGHGGRGGFGGRNRGNSGTTNNPNTTQPSPTPSSGL